MPLHSQPFANDGSRRVSLQQYAANFQDGILEAHVAPYVQHQINHDSHAVASPNQALSYQSPYPVLHHRAAQPVAIAHHLGGSSRPHHHSNHHPHSTAINPIAPTYNTHLAVPRTISHRKPASTSTATVDHSIGLPSPPSSAGHPSPEQPRHASLAHSSSSGPFSCCGKSYGSKYTFNRHRRESRTCPHGSGGRRFVCYICANTDQPFGRRASLKQHVQEVHRRSPEQANAELDTWYGRFGQEKDYPDAVRDLDRP